MNCQNINFRMWQPLKNGPVHIVFGLAERGNLHDNLTDSIKAVINSHRALSVRTSLLIPFLSNGVEGSISTSFFDADFIGRISDGLSIAVIDIDDDAEDRMILNYDYKDCDYLINYLLSLMDLILKLSENINMLHRWLLKNPLLQWWYTFKDHVTVCELKCCGRGWQLWCWLQWTKILWQVYHCVNEWNDGYKRCRIIIMLKNENNVVCRKETSVKLSKRKKGWRWMEKKKWKKI